MPQYDEDMLQPGDKLPDGTIYVGISPDTNRPFYAAAEDAPKLMDQTEADRLAASFNVAGHGDWRVPSEAERDMLFKVKQEGALKGTFNEEASNPASWYLSRPEFRGYNESDNERNFGNGDRDYAMKINKASVRFVRG